MILLLGSTGYIGEAFASELARRGKDWKALSRKDLNYANFDAFLE